MEKATINQCVLTLTRNCNLRCDFCYAKETGYKENDYIIFEDLTKIVDFCNDLEINDIVLTGGEPTLYKELIKLLKYICSRKRVMSVSMSSNGIKLSNYEYCKELIDNGIKYIDISLKGNNEDNCTIISGVNCLESQLVAINNLSKLPVTLTCSMVLTEENVIGFCDVIKKAYDYGARQFSFSFVLDNNVSDKKGEEYFLSNNPCKLVDDFVSQIKMLDDITHGEWWVEYTFPLCVYTKEQLDLLEGRLASPCQIFNGLGITFDTNKRLIPCSMFINTFLGQFEKDFSSAEEFEKYSDLKHYVDSIDELKKLPSDKCKFCDLFERCNGGCPIFWKNTTFEDFNKFLIKNGR